MGRRWVFGLLPLSIRNELTSINVYPARMCDSD